MTAIRNIGNTAHLEILDGLFGSHASIEWHLSAAIDKALDFKIKDVVITVEQTVDRLCALSVTITGHTGAIIKKPFRFFKCIPAGEMIESALVSAKSSATITYRKPWQLMSSKLVVDITDLHPNGERNCPGVSPL